MSVSGRSGAVNSVVENSALLALAQHVQDVPITDACAALVRLFVCNGVLADVHFGQLFRIENPEPARYLGRHIVIGTVVDTPRNAPVPHGIRTVVDMRDTLSPLRRSATSRHAGYQDNEEEGGI